MKIQNNLRARTLLAAALALGATVAHATVGGPTLIYDFRYNPADESVYYIEEDHGGRGCPPELYKLSLNSGAASVVYSCDQGSAEGASPVSEIDAIIEGFKPLSPISLKKNGIEVDVDFVRSEMWEYGSDSGVSKRHFTATVYQRGGKVAELPVAGCNLEQPFTFAGYAIPGFEKKIALLLSTKGDCFEGGYTNETLHMVGGVGGLDKDFSYNSMKWSQPLAPNEGTLVVFEADEIAAPVDEKPDEDDDEPAAEVPVAGADDGAPSAAVLVTVAVVSVLAGLGLGRLVR